MCARSGAVRKMLASGEQDFRKEAKYIPIPDLPPSCSYIIDESCHVHMETVLGPR